MGIVVTNCTHKPLYTHTSFHQHLIIFQTVCHERQQEGAERELLRLACTTDTHEDAQASSFSHWKSHW